MLTANTSVFRITAASVGSGNESTRRSEQDHGPAVPGIANDAPKITTRVCSPWTAAWTARTYSPGPSIAPVTARPKTAQSCDYTSTRACHFCDTSTGATVTANSTGGTGASSGDASFSSASATGSAAATSTTHPAAAKVEAGSC